MWGQWYLYPGPQGSWWGEGTLLTQDGCFWPTVLLGSASGSLLLCLPSSSARTQDISSSAEIRQRCSAVTWSLCLAPEPGHTVLCLLPFCLHVRGSVSKSVENMHREQMEAGGPRLQLCGRGLAGCGRPAPSPGTERVKRKWVEAESRLHRGIVSHSGKYAQGKITWALLRAVDNQIPNFMQMHMALTWSWKHRPLIAELWEAEMGLTQIRIQPVQLSNFVRPK